MLRFGPLLLGKYYTTRTAATAATQITWVYPYATESDGPTDPEFGVGVGSVDIITFNIFGKLVIGRAYTRPTNDS